MTRVKRWLAGWGLVMLLLAGVGAAKAAGQSHLALNPLMERARSAIAAGDIAEGQRILDEVDPRTVDPNDLDFLRGIIAVAKHDYRAGIARFKAILRRNPSLNRVRLELARAYFLAGDDVAAEHYFRAAAAEGVPPEVQQNINGFLDQIRRRKHWNLDVEVGLAPDTNINAATTAQSIELLGLPFTLNPSARQQSGVGFTANLGGYYQWDIAHDTQYKIGLTYYDTEYSKQEFSDRILDLYTGPHFLLSRDSEISVLAMGSKRWYGNMAFTSGVGGRIEGQTQLSPRTTLAATIGAEHLHYDLAGFEAYTGPVIVTNVTVTHALNAYSFIRGLGGVVREQTQLAGLRDTQYSLGAEYYRENLPYGFALDLAVEGIEIPYDAPLTLFGITRHDTEMDYRVSVSDHRIDIGGFTPVISFIHTDHYANITLYAFHRNRGEIGVTRNF